MRGETAMAWRLRAATRSLMSASRAFDEFPQGLDRLAGGGARLEFENCAHAGKHKGVTPVSLGEFSRGLGEASGLTGIDLDPRQADLDHRLFQQALVEAGLPWVKVNPCQARRFAQATGKLAKTDRCDALMLARMAQFSTSSRAPQPARRSRP